MPGTNRLSGITASNPATFTYDANGCITSNGVHAFAYNQANRFSQGDKRIPGESDFVLQVLK